ncbi:MAG: relaxase/mobilization nuclease domain-containing protein [Ruminococcus flavefaciens]|nr:relaxase/mobilization nuclease domain-containing protein [Ruminococcus flavefaciens]
MDILKVKRVTDGGKSYLSNAVGYCFKEKLEPGEELIETVGYGVSSRNQKSAYSQMYAVKKYFGKTGDNPLLHFVVSFDNHVCDAETACAYTRQIAEIFRNDYQLETAVHMENQGGSQYHSHFIVNSVNYNNGKLFHSGITELKQIAMQIYDITGNYCSIKFE